MWQTVYWLSYVPRPSTYIKMEELQAVSHVYRLIHLPLETLLPSFAPQTLDGAWHPGISSPHRITSPESTVSSHSPELFYLSHPHKLIRAPLGSASLLSVNLRIYFHLFPLFSALVSFSRFTCKKICESSKLLHSGKKKSILTYVMKQSLIFTIYSFVLLWWEPWYVSLAGPNSWA